ncbi:SAM-dependent methyltransferase [Actinomadura roseirufa]|uniref:SAM-dependent methyltransferase n=1 Tax=Actinomadura roseirufa TaxID=2094049 RepID=UPI0010410A11|nr:SAM-dependent methyltransferase [Actinomadura roseirufa]
MASALDGGPIPDSAGPYRPSPARVYDFFLGGTDNRVVDRLAAVGVREAAPSIPQAASAVTTCVRRVGDTPVGVRDGGACRPQSR